MTTIRTALSPRCYLCNSNGDYLYEGLKDRLYDVQGDWNFKMCSNPDCKLAWLDPVPLPNDIHKVYRHYFTHDNRFKSNRHISAKSLFITFARRVFYVVTGALALRRMRHELVKMYFPNGTKGRLLEIGCGDGFRLERMRNYGWNVEGQEIDPAAAQNASSTYGMKVHLGKLENIRLPSDSFDAIIMVHVLEHVHEPRLILNECHRLLKPGGCLVCITPNIYSYGHKQFKSSWLHLDPPRHLYLYSPKSILLLLDKLDFNKYNIITTPASAEYTYYGSKNIIKTNMLQLQAEPQWSNAIPAMIFQRRALAAFMQDNMTGEEIVIKMIKD